MELFRICKLNTLFPTNLFPVNPFCKVTVFFLPREELQVQSYIILCKYQAII